MSNLQEVPTEELLSFQDYPSVHNSGNNTTIPISDAQLEVDNLNQSFMNFPSKNGSGDATLPLPATEPQEQSQTKSFWTIEYYQKYFDVDTREVIDRIAASVTPKYDSSLKHHLRTKPDLYGPFWISVTLIFTIAISGNIADYLHHANDAYRWKYDFHLVSYAATTICLYVTVIPLVLFGLLKWSSQRVNDNLEDSETDETPGALELICIYGYSLFIYIPVSVLWSIQIDLLQWSLVLIAVLVSGSVLIFTLLPALRLSRHKILLAVGIVVCHLLLAAGFMLYFFHGPKKVSLVKNVKEVINSTVAAVTMKSR